MKTRFISIALVLLTLTLVGCDDSSHSGPAEGVDVTGTWQGQSSDFVSFTTTLVMQSDGTVNGTIRREEGFTGAATGSVNGTRFQMHIIWSYGGTGDYDGDVSGDAIEGDFTERDGSTTMTGTFTAFRN